MVGPPALVLILATVRVWIGPFGPYLSSSGRGLRTDKVPEEDTDVLRLVDIGSLIKVGFSNIVVPDQEDVVATSNQTLNLAPGTAILIVTDPNTNGLSINLNFGTGAGQVCEGNDSRLSDARDPLAHADTHAPDGSDPVAMVFTD